MCTYKTYKNKMRIVIQQNCVVFKNSLTEQIINIPSFHNNGRSIFAWCRMHEHFFYLYCIKYGHCAQKPVFLILNECMSEGICVCMEPHCIELELLLCERTLGLWMNEGAWKRMHDSYTTQIFIKIFVCLPLFLYLFLFLIDENIISGAEK